MKIPLLIISTLFCLTNVFSQSVSFEWGETHKSNIRNHVLEILPTGEKNGILMNLSLVGYGYIRRSPFVFNNLNKGEGIKFEKVKTKRKLVYFDFVSVHDNSFQILQEGMMGSNESQLVIQKINTDGTVGEIKDVYISNELKVAERKCQKEQISISENQNYIGFAKFFSDKSKNNYHILYSVFDKNGSLMSQSISQIKTNTEYSKFDLLNFKVSNKGEPSALINTPKKLTVIFGKNLSNQEVTPHNYERIFDVNFEPINDKLIIGGVAQTENNSKKDATLFSLNFSIGSKTFSNINERTISDEMMYSDLSKEADDIGENTFKVHSINKTIDSQSLILFEQTDSETTRPEEKASVGTEGIWKKDNVIALIINSDGTNNEPITISKRQHYNFYRLGSFIYNIDGTKLQMIYNDHSTNFNDNGEFVKVIPGHQYFKKEEIVWCLTTVDLNSGEISRKAINMDSKKDEYLIINTTNQHKRPHESSLIFKLNSKGSLGSLGIYSFN